jgi:glycosyltransferase involved in cell wall biosynthesis
VSFIGNQYPVAPYLDFGDVVVVPSRREALGYVLLEAMALGKPIVATRVGGIPEVLEDGLTGRLVPSGSPIDLANGIVELFTHPELARRLGEAARAIVSERYSAAQMAKGVAEVYQKVLA